MSEHRPAGPSGAPGDDDLAALVRRNARSAAADLTAARRAGRRQTEAFLSGLVGSGGQLLVYRPERGHYGVLLGDLASARHVAIVVPGVGGPANVAAEWLPWSENLHAAAPASAVIMWKGYDDPPGFPNPDVLAAAMEHRAQAGGRELGAFVRSLAVDEHQTLTLIGHSYGSVVVGCALARESVRCTNVVVLGSPGMTVERLGELHLPSSHFFAEQAPRDPVAGLGAFGTDPSSPTFGGTRLATNHPGRPAVVEHSSYFEKDSEALSNLADVVTARYADLDVQAGSLADSAGGMVTTVLKGPFVPATGYLTRHYTGAAAGALEVTDHTANLVDTEAGNLARDGIDAVAGTSRALVHFFLG